MTSLRNSGYLLHLYSLPLLLEYTHFSLPYTHTPFLLPTHTHTLSPHTHTPFLLLPPTHTHFPHTHSFPPSPTHTHTLLPLHRVGLWHQVLIGEDIFLGQVNISVGSLRDTAKAHVGWYLLSPRHDSEQNSPRSDLGTIRLGVKFSRVFIFPLVMYEPLKSLLLQSLGRQV